MALVQYTFTKGEHKVIPKPHGNSKSLTAFYRVLPSTRSLLKSCSNMEKTPKEGLDKLYQSLGDITDAKSLGELPRGPSDLYYARHAEKKARLSQGNVSCESNDKFSYDSIFTLIERARREKETRNGSPFIRECNLHPDFTIVLATDRQLQHLEYFCTDPKEFCIYSVDPTFNVFEDNISLTVTSYRNLKLKQKKTGKAPVFIGPMMLHQKKDCKTYSRFFNTLVTENEHLSGVLASGTDGEKPLIAALKKAFPFSIRLRCFIHFKDNIKRELNSRNISSENRSQFLYEIFGKQDGEVKYCGLVDSESAEEFEQKLESLKGKWNAREETSNSTFFDWFVKEKVIILLEHNCNIE